MNTLPFEYESDLIIKYAAMNPQLCGVGGKNYDISPLI